MSRLLVLAWHNTAPTWGFPGSGDSRGVAFARQLTLLRRWARVVPLAPALDALRDGRRLPPRAVALTFDDGYRDQLDLAAPILRRFGMTATFFLVTGFCEQRSRAWWEELGWAFGAATRTSLEWPPGDGVRYDLRGTAARDAARAAVTESLKALTAAERHAAITELIDRLRPYGTRPGPEQFCDWDAARALRDAGHTIGAHTVSHPILAREDAAAQWDELAGARHELERRLAVPADILAYPNGRAADYDPVTLDHARRAGYRYALTTETGLVTSRTAALEVRRCVISPRSGARDLGRELRWLATATARTVARGASARCSAR